MSEQIIQCNRTACNDTAHPCGYNSVTHGLYCLPCAHRISAHGDVLFPLLGFESEVRDGGKYVAGVIATKVGAS